MTETQQTSLEIMKPFISKTFWQSVRIISVTSLRESYRNSFLGVLWSMIHPAAYIIVLSVVFSTIWRMPIRDYFVYMASGMMAWQFMAGALTKSANALLGRRNVFHHSLIPKSLFIVSDLIVAAYIFVITIIMLMVILAVMGQFNIMSLVYLPIAMIPLLLLCLGGSFMLAYISPYIGDIPHLTNLFFMVAFWTCPISYPVSMIPENRRIYFEYNPLYLIIEPVQNAIYRGEAPVLFKYNLAIAFALLVCALGYITHAKLRRRVIYYL